MQDYVFNFGVWWYLIKVPLFTEQVMRRIVFILEYTNTLDMARNLTTPLFQDNSGVGKLISFVIRLIWVWWGGMISAVVAIPLLLALLAFLLLPVAAIVLTISGLIATLF